MNADNNISDFTITQFVCTALSFSTVISVWRNGEIVSGNVFKVLGVLGEKNTDWSFMSLFPPLKSKNTLTSCFTKKRVSLVDSLFIMTANRQIRSDRATSVFGQSWHIWLIDWLTGIQTNQCWVRTRGALSMSLIELRNYEGTDRQTEHDKRL